VSSHDLGPIPARTSIGLQWRADRARVGLFDSVARVATTTVREDEVRQQTASAYAQSSLEFSERWRAVLGLRADHLRAEVDALTLPANSGSASATQLSPKLSIVHTLAQRTEVFLNAGRGLHSNDARGTTARVDPRSGAPLDPVPPLVAVKGSELGLRTEAIKGLQSSLTLWRLASESELVYVGDAGTTEPSLASRRRGVEFNNRYVPAPWLLIDADFAWNHARFADGARIPNAVDRVALVGVTLRKVAGFSGSLNWRYLGSAALTEDNSVRSLPASTMNFRLTRELLPKVALTLDVFNLADRKVNDIQYYYASQLPGEAAPVDDRHVHPAEPRRVRLTLQASF
jgi:outer membrane receptor protein involved in Fe transport